VVPVRARAEEAEAMMEEVAESVATPRSLVARAPVATEKVWVALQLALKRPVLVSVVSELPIRAHRAAER
jgi:hypothetical protein